MQAAGSLYRGGRQSTERVQKTQSAAMIRGVVALARRPQIAIERPNRHCRRHGHHGDSIRRDRPGAVRP